MNVADLQQRRARTRDLARRFAGRPMPSPAPCAPPRALPADRSDSTRDAASTGV